MSDFKATHKIIATHPSFSTGPAEVLVARVLDTGDGNIDAGDREIYAAENGDRYELTRSGVRELESWGAWRPVVEGQRVQIEAL